MERNIIIKIFSKNETVSTDGGKNESGDFIGYLRELMETTDWSVFKARLEQFCFIANNITNDEGKRAILLNIV